MIPGPWHLLFKVPVTCRPHLPLSGSLTLMPPFPHLKVPVIAPPAQGQGFVTVAKSPGPQVLGSECVTCRGHHSLCGICRGGLLSQGRSYWGLKKALAREQRNPWETEERGRGPGLAG